MPGLEWDNKMWCGYLDIIPREYDAAYFDKYAGYEDTSLGKMITKARIEFVNAIHKGEVLDIGIGSGHFVSNRSRTYGYDVNPKGVAWLKERGLYRDPQEGWFPAYSFFDSFEHIKDPSPLLRAMSIGAKVFISIPIFNDMAHILRSKHFRPDEHYWYFTGLGFVKYMGLHDFRLLDVDDFESRLGREDIKSFAFVKDA
jgi:hypothetical protein